MEADSRFRRLSTRQLENKHDRLVRRIYMQRGGPQDDADLAAIRRELRRRREETDA